MLVRDRMTKNPYTIQASAGITELMGLIREKNLKRVPVLDGEKVVGMISTSDIDKVSPTKATSLSVFEINYLLSKVQVKDAMKRNFIAISPDELVEDAAVEMRAARVSAVPVVDNGKLVGIMTESDLFDALIDVLGARQIGTRFVVSTKDKGGVLSEVSTIISNHGVNILHLAVVRHEGKDDASADMILRVDSLEVEEILQEIEAKGYSVSGVMKNRG